MALGVAVSGQLEVLTDPADLHVKMEVNNSVSDTNDHQAQSLAYPALGHIYSIMRSERDKAHNIRHCPLFPEEALKTREVGNGVLAGSQALRRYKREPEGSGAAGFDFYLASSGGFPTVRQTRVTYQ